MAKMSSTRRKLAIATWAPPNEGTIFGKLTLDVTDALEYIEQERERSGTKVTITHLVGKATANALAAAPTLNGKILFYRFVPFDTVDVTFLVALEGGANLGKVKIDNANEKSVAQIANELRAAAEKMKSGKDPAWEKSKGALKVMPGFLLRPMIRMTGWLASALGVNIPALGVERHAFGSCIITSVGMLGFDEGYAPFTPFARVPILLLVGAIRDTPSVHEGEICIRKKITVTATVDHRFIDGFQLGVLAKEFRAVLEEPFQNLGELEDPHQLATEDPSQIPDDIPEPDEIRAE